MPSSGPDRLRRSSVSAKYLRAFDAMAGAGQPLDDCVELFAGEVEPLQNAAVQHGHGDVLGAALLLDLVEDEQDDSLPAREAVADVGDVVVPHVPYRSSATCSQKIRSSPENSGSLTS